MESDGRKVESGSFGKDVYDVLVDALVDASERMFLEVFLCLHSFFCSFAVFLRVISRKFLRMSLFSMVTFWMLLICCVDHVFLWAGFFGASCFHYMCFSCGFVVCCGLCDLMLLLVFLRSWCLRIFDGVVTIEFQPLRPFYCDGRAFVPLLPHCS